MTLLAHVFFMFWGLALISLLGFAIYGFIEYIKEYKKDEDK